VEVDDVRAVHFEEMLFAHFFFQVFNGIVCDVFFFAGYNKPFACAICEIASQRDAVR
jgi:hypothetical protein